MNGMKRIRLRTSSEYRIFLPAVPAWSPRVLAKTISRTTVASVDTVPSRGRNNITVGQLGWSWSNTSNAVIENATRIRKLRAQVARFKFTTLSDGGKAELC